MTFSCPPGPLFRSGASGGASTPVPAGATLHDIVDIAVTIFVPGDPQSMRYILTDTSGVKYYSDWVTTIPGPGKTNTDWFALSFGLPVATIAPPSLFSPLIIANRDIDVTLLKGVLTTDQYAIAQSLDGISRLTYAQEILGSPVSKAMDLSIMADIEFETRGTSVGAPVYELGQVYARVNYTSPAGSGIGDVIIDDFEPTTVTTNTGAITDAAGVAPTGWSISGTGGSLLGTLGDNTNAGVGQRIIFSKIPPGGGCQMYYKQVQWYERGWRINACCGAWIELNGVQWLIVKRSIGTNISCGGGESENTICIQQYIASGQGHPAIAWPTINGQEFLGLPTSGFVNFIKDAALSAALLDKLEQGQYLAVEGEPISQIPFILFPAN